MSAGRPILILGPTAGGKSELGARLAAALGGCVLSADSMQVFRRMQAGTAKPTPRQCALAPHRLVDLVEPNQPFSVADWLRAADQAAADAGKLGQRVVVVGGTNLYVKAWLEGLMEGPGRDADFRAALAGVEAPELHRRLAAVDPPAATRLHPNDRQRIVRALEVHHLTGRPLSAQQREWGDDAGTAAPADGRPAPILLGLQWPVEAINARINLRVKAMFHPAEVEAALARDICLGGESLPDETRRLLAEGWFAPLADGSPNQARESLGTKQSLAAMEGGDPLIHTIHDAYERTRILTRQFAKRQRTWLKRFAGVHWLAAEGRTAESLLDEALGVVAAAPRLGA